MNYIFLDIDGVLNNMNRMLYIYNHREDFPNWDLDYNFDERSYKALGKIVRKNKALVIVTSSWRYALEHNKFNDDLIREFFRLCNKYHICIHGWTTIEYKSRGAQIKEYIDKKLKSKDKFVIIDDETCDIDSYYSSEHVYKTDEYIGLQKEDIKKVNKLFRKQMK